MDSVIHNGAQVSGVLPYSVLKKPNVLGIRNFMEFSYLLVGTLQLLQFCNTSKQKPLFFVSSIGIFASQSQVVHESTPLPDHVLFLPGYSQSKWVAEKLLITAMKRGFPISIMRPVWNVGEILQCRVTSLVIHRLAHSMKLTLW